MLKKTVSSLVLAAFCALPLAASAQHGDYDGHPHPYVRHTEWKKGYHLDQSRWNDAPRVDYQHYHLHRPPNGYEWREVDGNFVLAAVATGIIASVVAASH